MAFTNMALVSIRDHIRSRLSYARYKVGSTYYRAEFNTVYVRDDGSLAVTFYAGDNLTGIITVTEAQLFDVNGALWYSKALNVTTTATANGILCLAIFKVSEVELTQ